MKSSYRRVFAIFLSLLLALSVGIPVEAVSPPQPNIGLNGFFSVDKAQQGRTIGAAVVVHIPDGYHINSNRPLAKYLIPTSVKVEGPNGVRIGTVSYPRALMRKFSFSEDQLAVYEGRAVIRFNVTVPASFSTGVTKLRARVRYQSCNDEACFPPVTRTVEMPIAVVGANESVRRINKNLFRGR